MGKAKRSTVVLDTINRAEEVLTNYYLRLRDRSQADLEETKHLLDQFHNSRLILAAERTKQERNHPIGS